MSALGCMDACETICICPRCANRKITCGPCMDCNDKEYEEYDNNNPEHSEEPTSIMGYHVKCDRFVEIEQDRRADDKRQNKMYC